jgi:hypothetical protein
MPAVPLIRQVVLLVPELEPALEQFRQAFGLGKGITSPGMAKLGFTHEVFTFGDSFLEICAPLKADSHSGRLVARKGAMGYMVVVQVDNLDNLVTRAAAQGIQPLFVQDLHGNAISQWHPKALGTLVEFDQINPVDSWHYAPQVFERKCTDVALDIVGAVLAVADPEAMASTWSTLLEAPRVDSTTLDLQRTRLRFVPMVGERPGLVEVELDPRDVSRVGERIRLGGVDFSFVSARGAGK